MNVEYILQPQMRTKARHYDQIFNILSNAVEVKTPRCWFHVFQYYMNSGPQIPYLKNEWAKPCVLLKDNK